MKKKILLIPCLARMLSGWNQVIDYLIPDPVEESAAPEEEKKEEVSETKEVSLHPDEVTE